MHTEGTQASEALRTIVLAASAADDWASAQIEWSLVASAVSMTHSGVCCCGRTGLKYLYTIQNRLTGNVLRPIGSTCIKKHFTDPVLLDALRTHQTILGMEDKVLSGTQLDLHRDLRGADVSALRKADVLSERQHQILMDAFEIQRALTEEELVGIDNLMRTVVVPALGGEEIEAAESPEYMRGVGDGQQGLTPIREATGYRLGHLDGLKLYDEMTIDDDLVEIEALQSLVLAQVPLEIDHLSSEVLEALHAGGTISNRECAFLTQMLQRGAPMMTTRQKVWATDILRKGSSSVRGVLARDIAAKVDTLGGAA